VTTETQHLRYEAIIFWSDEDEAFIAEFPELPGCMADGTTPQSALENLHAVAHLWIETARELNRPVPEPRGRLLLA